jgi:hypothetical protein
VRFILILEPEDSHSWALYSKLIFEPSLFRACRDDTLNASGVDMQTGRPDVVERTICVYGMMDVKCLCNHRSGIRAGEVRSWRIVCIGIVCRNLLAGLYFRK